MIVILTDTGMMTLMTMTNSTIMIVKTVMRRITGELLLHSFCGEGRVWAFSGLALGCLGGVWGGSVA